MSGQHTPGPLSAQIGEAVTLHDAEGGRIAILGHLKGPHGMGGRRDPDEVAATARRIVQCWNQHDELVELLRRARKSLAWAIDGCEPAKKRDVVERPALMLKTDYDEALAVCAAIAKATGNDA